MKNIIFLIFINIFYPEFFKKRQRWCWKKKCNSRNYRICKWVW